MVAMGVLRSEITPTIVCNIDVDNLSLRDLPREATQSGSIVGLSEAWYILSTPFIFVNRHSHGFKKKRYDSNDNVE